MKKSNRQRVHSNYYVEIVFFCNNNNNIVERHLFPFVFSQKKQNNNPIFVVPSRSPQKSSI